MSYIIPIDRNQYRISSLEDIIGKENPVRIIDALVEKIVYDNKEYFNKKQNKTEVGRPEYHPTVMLKLYLYGYFNGINSSRKIEIETKRNVEVNWLIGCLTPDHWTISMFRKDNSAEIKEMTKKFRHFLKDKRYILGKMVAIDGSKVKANASKEFLDEEKINKHIEELEINLEEKMEEYLSKMDAMDTAEDNIEQKETELKLLEKKIKKVKKDLGDYAELNELRKAKGKNSISKTDPECNFMKSRNGLIPGYNVQIISDSKNKMIADSEVTTEANDLNQLEPMIESIKEELDITPEKVLADKGYNKPDMIEKVTKQEGIKCYIPNVETSRDREEIKFTYNENGDYVECSEGKKLVLISKNKKKNNSIVNQYRGIECDGCKLREQCTKSPKGRTYYIYANEEWRKQYRKEMGFKRSVKKHKKRKELVEHIFGNLKMLMGWIPLRLRGKEKVSIEINLFTTVYNLKRLINIEKEKGLNYLLSIINNYHWKIA